MKTTSVFILCLSLLACGPTEETAIPDQCLRQIIFFKCLKNIPVGPKEAKYNDWDEVVGQCDSVAYWQSMRQRKLISAECLPGSLR